MSNGNARTVREEWGTRFGFLMAMLGAMVGAGNIWRMPFTTGQNGGGTFLIAYALLLFLIAIPGLMAETMLGRYTGKGVIGSFKQILGDKRYAGFALVVVLVNVAVMSYYSTIIGWSMYYGGHSLLLTFFESGFEATPFWESFVGSPLLTIGTHTLTMAAIAGVLVFGIKRGIERVVKYVMPFLVIALIAIGVRGLTLPGGMEGLAFAFTPEWNYFLRGDMWVAALGQALFSTGLGWGIALTYGSYLRKHDDVALGGGVFTAVGNTSIGLLAIFAVFPVVFAFGLEPAGGANLMFISLVQVFPQLAGGPLWAIGFFLGFFFATFSSGIAITEVGVTTVTEETRLSRTQSVLAVVGVIWLLGLPSAYDSSFLSAMDYIFGNFGFPLATLCIIWLVGWKLGPERARVLDLNRNADLYVGSWWNGVVKYIIPVVLVFIIGNGAVNSLGTDNQTLMIGGIALMFVLTAVSIWIMRIVPDGKSSDDSVAASQGGD
ncbi:transporter [Haloarcula mannanilytica]|uniref:Transporter n=1 Tax=Haloarcula mannanilytica TaxID=2509225 RepID=A0A4C2EUZ6_9EURY|nr:sodium-dependent transporter [Haloarcula mannanilytica]GCF16029.1 transporter [Haloarcula mannanilytica]